MKDIPSTRPSPDVVEESILYNKAKMGQIKPASLPPYNPVSFEDFLSLTQQIRR